MKKQFALLVCAILVACAGRAQDADAPINTTWHIYAADTSRTFYNIVTFCDSMFALAGYTDSMELKTDSADTEGMEEGSSFVQYLRWKGFWEHRCDVTTGKLHDFAADAAQQLAGQNKTTSITNCAGTSALQASITSGPMGWEYIGPKNVISVPSGIDYGNSLQQFLGQANQIIVHPSNHARIYFRDRFGGIWKTTTGLDASPSWTCVTDNLPSISGVGVTDFHVDFGSSPTTDIIYALVGIPNSGSLPNYTNGNPRTLGVFYSTNGGSAFSQMALTGGTYSPLTSFADEPVFAMAIWPGNSSSINKYMFITTRLRVIRINITNPASISYQVMINGYGLSLGSPVESGLRFRGFSAIAFDKVDPDIMYVSTVSNNGNPFPNTAALYRIDDCSTCSTSPSCGLTYIPRTADNILKNKADENRGDFQLTTESFPYPGWRTWGWERDEGMPGDFFIKSTPYDTASRVEMEVYGSYLHPVTYNISFKITLPGYTEVDVLLKDSHPDKQYDCDWGSSTAGPASFPGMRGNFWVGSGFSGSGGSPSAGHYRNDAAGTATFTVTTSITATLGNYVNRLEFGSYKISSLYSGGDVRLDDISVTQEYERYISCIQGAPSSAGALYCISSKQENVPKFQQITPSGGSYSIAEYPTPGAPEIRPNLFTVSSVNPNIIYWFRAQASFDPRILKFDLSTPSVAPVPDPYTKFELHPDVRCLTVLPNSSGTDDTLFVGHDGGLAKGTFSGHWTGLNGTGLRTSWLNDVGSSSFTGEVGVAASDNGVFWSKPRLFNQWYNYADGDGGQFKYGRSAQTRTLRFRGFTPGGLGFTKLGWNYMGGEPYADGASIANEIVLGLTKMANTFHGDFYGSAKGRCHVYKLKVSLGSGTLWSHYNFNFDSITRGSGYAPRYPVQAIAADMNDPDYMVVYSKQGIGDQGHFNYTANASATTPTWLHKNNDAVDGTAQALTTLIVDPEYHSGGKRLWAGADGYGTAGVKRAFESTDGGVSWHTISWGLPSGPVNALVYDDASHYLFAGTDQGVYAYNVEGGVGAGNPWVCYSLNLPNAFITGLEVNRCSGKIYASSYGRGAYQAELPPSINDGELIGTGAPITWSQDRLQLRNVIVPSGANLTISGCNVYMGRDMIIKVMPGGKLTVTNATITNNCDGCFWQGIVAVGNPSLPQSAGNQGWVVIKNNSTITNARNAVTNYDVFSATPLMYTGGIIQASGSTFLNNYNSISMKPYTAPGSPASADLSYFKGCTFLNTIQYRGYDIGLPMREQVSLTGVRGIKIAGCSFLNRDWRLSGAGEGVGINSFNASFSVVPHCSNLDLSSGVCLSSWRRPYFAGLEDGVVYKTTLWNYDMTYVDKSDFDSMSIGVLASGPGHIMVSGSNFIVGRANPYDSTVIGTPACGNIGVAVLNAPLALVTENRFVGRALSGPVVYPNFYKYGTVVVGSGGMPKDILKNKFDSLTEGVRSVGNNRIPTITSSMYSYGLHLRCNSFKANYYDISATSDGSSSPQGLGPQMGAINNPLKNTFTGSFVNINNAVLPFTYYYDNLFTSTERPGGTPSGVVMVGTSNVNNTCALLYNPPGTGSSGSSSSSSDFTALDMSTLSNVKASYYQNNSSLSGYVASRAQQLDMGGQTNYLKNYIDTATSDTALYQLLRSASPWLSVEVILHVPTSGILSYDQMDSILTSNPDVLQNSDVLLSLLEFFAELQQNDPQLPDYVSHLKDAANYVSTRTPLEANITSSLYNREEAGRKVIFALASLSDTSVSVSDTTGLGICLDSNSVYYTLDSNTRYYGADSLDAWLQRIGGYDAPYERMGLYLAKGQYLKADSIYAAIDSTLLPPEDIPSYRSFGKLMNVLSQAYANGRNIFTLNTQDIASLDTFTAHELNFNRARRMLWNLSTSIVDATSLTTSPLTVGTPFIPFKDMLCVAVLYPPSPTEKQIRYRAPYKIIGKRKVKEMYLNVYPNPSKDIVTFEFKIPETILRAGAARLSIADAIGMEVATYEVDESIGKVRWNSKAAPAGVYVYQLSSATGVLSSGKVVILK